MALTTQDLSNTYNAYLQTDAVMRIIKFLNDTTRQIIFITKEIQQIKDSGRFDLIDPDIKQTLAAYWGYYQQLIEIIDEDDRIAMLRSWDASENKLSLILFLCRSTAGNSKTSTINLTI